MPGPYHREAHVENRDSCRRRFNLMPRNGGSQRRVIKRLQKPGEKSTACAWCGRAIYWLNMIPKQDIIKISPATVTIRTDTGPRQFLIVTVDHYFELRDGGTNEARNLLPACAPCNLARSAQAKTRPDVCVDCGGKMTGAARRRCTACCEIRKREHFANESEPPIVYAN